jgi:dTDP-4-amino-4,6-dideoxygalactose transaminase
MSESPAASNLILFCDLQAGYAALSEEIDQAALRVLKSGWYILGSEVASFEQEFAAFLGCSQAIGVASGTDALSLAIRACGLKPGDAAITVSHTAVATVAALELAGVIPVLVDIDPQTFTMDPHSVETALASSGELRPRIKALVPVHLYGHPASMKELQQIARAHDLKLIEDCSQSHGAMRASVVTGNFGDAAAFSLYPTKNLGALGDAGIVVTGNQEVADQVRLLRQYGWRTRNCSEVAGINSRLDEIQAAILRVRLRHLTVMNDARIQIARRYSERLVNSSVTLPICQPDIRHVYHQYVIRTSNRDVLQTGLRDRGIQTQIHYPLPVHLQPAYQNRLPRLVSLQETERAAGEILSLPMYPQLSLEDVDRVAAAVCELRPRE